MKLDKRGPQVGTVICVPHLIEKNMVKRSFKKMNNKKAARTSGCKTFR